MSGTGTPMSLGAMLLPIMMFVGAGYSAAKAYDSKKAKSKMMYFWALIFFIFLGGGYFTLTQGLTLKNLGNRAKAAAQAGQQRYANYQASRAVGIQPPPVGAVNMAPPPVAAAAPMVPV